MDGDIKKVFVTAINDNVAFRSVCSTLSKIDIDFGLFIYILFQKVFRILYFLIPKQPVYLLILTLYIK